MDTNELKAKMFKRLFDNTPFQSSVIGQKATNYETSVSKANRLKMRFVDSLVVKRDANFQFCYEKFCNKIEVQKVDDFEEICDDEKISIDYDVFNETVKPKEFQGLDINENISLLSQNESNEIENYRRKHRKREKNKLNKTKQAKTPSQPTKLVIHKSKLESKLNLNYLANDEKLTVKLKNGIKYYLDEKGKIVKIGEKSKLSNSKSTIDMKSRNYSVSSKIKTGKQEHSLVGDKRSFISKGKLEERKRNTLAKLEKICFVPKPKNVIM